MSNETILLESMQLIQWEPYLRLVAQAYVDAPLYDPAALPSYKAMIRDTEKFFEMISSKVDVQWVDYDPYSSAEELRSDVLKSKTLRVMTLYSDHPVLTPEQNWKFRAVHDWFTHILTKTAFTPKGEIASFNNHAKMYSPAALPALFTEIVGQVAYNAIRGGFPVQKVAILPGFNYKKLGEVEGYVIQKKALILKPRVIGVDQQEERQRFATRLAHDLFEATLLELGPEAKRPHKCDSTHRFNVFARRCVPLASMLNRKPK